MPPSRAPAHDPDDAPAPPSPRDIPTPRLDADLPVLARKDEIAVAIRNHRALVVCGATGSGKTTQLPQIALAAGRGRDGMIAHTQPRRIAARAVAARIAEELQVPLGGGGAVGVKVRFNDRTSDRTVLKLLTDGMLLAETQADPKLLAYDTVIIDEAHERSLNIDFLLGYLRRLLETRDDLKVIITSATIDPRRFSDHFGGPARCPIIEVSGRTYPIDIRYHPARDDEPEIDPRAIASAVRELMSARIEKGDVLVFLPGEREIRLAADAVRREGLDAEILPLFARLTTAEQDRIFHPTRDGRRRVILATNVAETSLTVPGIRHVVDTGLARISRYDPLTKIQRLPVEPISRASADQRAGRCGRLGPGVCIRLYDETSFRARPLFTDPEIRRTNLAAVLLRLLSLNLGSIDAFPFLDPPDDHAVRDARDTLFELGAIPTREPDGGGATLTPIGHRLARIPVDPRIARMILAAEDEGSLREVLVLAAALSIQDPRERPAGRQDEADRAHTVFRDDTSDFLTLLNIWSGFLHVLDQGGSSASRDWCRQNFLSHTRMREWLDTHEQLADIADELDLTPNTTPATPDHIHRALLTGLITNVACRLDAQSFEYRGVRGNAPSIFPGSALFKKAPRWIMAGEVVQTTRLYARTVAKIEPEWVEELAGHMFQRQLSDKHVDPDTGEPSAWERVSMSGVVVVPRRRVPLAPHDPAGARKLFIAESLAKNLYKPDSPLTRHNAAAVAHAKEAEAKLRRRGVIVDDKALAAWFEARVPPHVIDPLTFESWYDQATAKDPHALQLTPADILNPDAAQAAGEKLFPPSLSLIATGDKGEGRGEGSNSPGFPPPPTSASSSSSSSSFPLSYSLSPGKDDDGITLTLPLLALPLLTATRADWLVPGALPEKLLTLLKQLPKDKRARLESHTPLPTLADNAAALMTFAEGDLAHALSDAVAALTDIPIDPADWPFKALPAHQRLRVRVVDETGGELAIDRDLAKLSDRLAPKLAKARSAAARANFERANITTWDFDLPERVDAEVADDDASVTPDLSLRRSGSGYPTLIDESDSVRLTLAPDPDSAAALTSHAIRRLFALACQDEVHARLAALASIEDIARNYRQLGERDELIDHLTLLVAEKTFMVAQPRVRDRETFESRTSTHWGRLAQSTFEVADAVARALEPRARVAHRFSGGTPRLWAASVADIREHAAYLFPSSFLALAGWERIRDYPRYAEAMRARLLKLREDGKSSETDLLATFAPHWKRFTAWVAQRMADQRAAALEASSSTPDPSRPKKPPLPRARRAAPTVNLEAGDWALQPAHLPKPMAMYRWALEDHRVALFAPELAGGGAGLTFSAKRLDELWAKAQT